MCLLSVPIQKQVHCEANLFHDKFSTHGPLMKDLNFLKIKFTCDL